MIHKGKAKVQALVEKKKLVCIVTVDDKAVSGQQDNVYQNGAANVPGGIAGNPSPVTGGNGSSPTPENEVAQEPLVKPTEASEEGTTYNKVEEFETAFYEKIQVHRLNHPDGSVSCT